MNTDVEFHIRHNYPWAKLPANVKQSLGNSHREYEKAVFNFSVKNQLRYKGNLVRYVKKDEKRYYEELLRYSREHLMLYPYHLSDVMVKGLRITPFAYYLSIMSDIMAQEKSYDALPNFTAADCLRLLGIGRNQYIDLMNQCRSSKKFFKKKSYKELLPAIPVETVVVEPWWVVQAGYITEEDVKLCSVSEKGVIDKVIDSGPQSGGDLDYKTVHGLYRKGLIYMDVPITDEDCIIVPPLEGFVMNRVLGDYFETLLYKIFVSIDEHTSVAELANVLQIDSQLVKNAVSMYCRLGFARKKGLDINPDDLHPSWKNIQNTQKKPSPGAMLIDWGAPSENDKTTEKVEVTPQEENVTMESSTDISSLVNNAGHSKRMAFLFDSTLTAFLMMGNLSPGLKSHAVTMFEVGKLSDESLDSFLNELEKVDSVAEGEAQRYFDHALTLRDTIRFLRYNKDLAIESDGNNGYGIDLLRCESLLGLDPATCARVLNKNYRLLVSMAPLSNEIRPVSSCAPQHFGPAIPEVNSVWFKLFIYHITGCGPDSLLLVKGTKLLRLPKIFQGCEKLLITTWGHDPGVIPSSNILLMVNDALQHSAVLIQVYGYCHDDGHTEYVPFPFEKSKRDSELHPLAKHSALQRLASFLDLERTCGYVTLLHTGGYSSMSNLQLKTPEKPSLKSSDLDSPGSGTKSPQNGIKDSASAEMLASELDSLNMEENLEESQKEKVSLCKEKLTLDVASSDASHNTNIDSEWVLLECCYGIPLFASELNRNVYQRIASHGLVNKDSLQELLHSSRKLSLKLLNFIADNQDLPVFQETNYETSPITSSFQGDQSIPLPTHNLIFTNGALQTWDGQ